ncbi:hypothetical protein FA95DRAFT_1562363 [Auriscalpium vulgare]|uniref:Uncharacterized protein n=1 Tax=Auriscalpium vulgare TaxID=40419 RepID=A0ACB8RLC6_9AGAM|nr:hypothetical protein FA95DRAFT_1562363 [Auriscalpium vulgare]
MVNWNDPVVLARTSLDFVKLEHALAGVYIWEYVTHIDYEWDFISGRRKWVWTLVIYSLCRFSCLLFTIVNLVGMDVTTEINCQARLIAALTFAALAMVSASLLIVMRIAAIWQRNIYAVALSASVWLAIVAAWLQDIIKSKGIWNATGGGCLHVFTVRGRALSVISFVSDASLLVIMLVGLVSKREAARFSIWRTLYHQGLIWLSLATIAELPVTILLFKNINDVWNLMFQNPALLIMVMGATRMHRSLSNYANDSEHSRSSVRPPAVKGLNSQTGGMHFLRKASSTTNESYAMRPIEISVHRENAAFDEREEDADKVRTVELDLEVGMSGADHARYGKAEKAAPSGL